MAPVDNDELTRHLRAIGMQAYVEILFPAMMRDRDISIVELSKKYPVFSKYTPAAQSTRRTKARKIFDKGWQFAALDAILISSRTAPDVRTKAQALKSQYLK